MCGIRAIFATMTATLLTLAFLFPDPGPCGEAAAPEPLPSERRILNSFDYRGVTVEPGFLRKQIDGVKAFYLEIPNDDLLRGFRLRAGKPAPGKPLGGWYSDDLFHIFGQIISGLSRLYAATGDVACRDKANYLIAEWAKCIAPDGFFYFSKTPKSPHYTYDKLVGGLVDAHLYLHNPEALQHLHKITEWAIKNLERDRPCPTVENGNADEWYTLSENLYRAYLASGERVPIYRDFAQVWEYTDYWNMHAHRANLFAALHAGKPRSYHAYSHVNTLGGAAAAYLVTGKPHYLDTIRNAYDFFQTTECFATGGYGPDEHLFPPDALDRMLVQTHASFETQCGSWAVFKLCKNLISFTGDARYGNWIERLVYNGIGASIPNAKDGRVFYYADYNPAGARKGWHDVPWTCCAGTRPMAIADYCDLIYFHKPNQLCVNLYAASTVHFQANGKPVVLRQQTAFPEDTKVTFIVQCSEPAHFELKIRKPAWLATSATATLNDKPVDIAEDKLHWLTIERDWHSGDRLDLQLPMPPTPRQLHSEQSRHFAVTVGPVVLAAAAQHDSTAVRSPEQFVKALEPVPSEPLTYRVAGAPKVLLKPFYKFTGGEEYFLYFTAAAAAAPAPPPDTDDLVYVPNSTRRICQLTGDFDRATGTPTLSQTDKRFGVWGTDLGSSFEHKGKLYFLFGDTIGRPGARDALAWTESHDPTKIQLQFHAAKDGKWLPLTVPGISQADFEVPSSGVSVGGVMYVVCTTDHTEKKTMGRSVLAASHDDGLTFKVVYELSRTKFINVSFGATEEWLYIYGSGDYRKSNVCLARIRPQQFEDRSKLEYFAGVGPEGQPRWSPKEADAVPLFHQPQVGEFSVKQLKPVNRYVMLYNATEPRGITMRSARAPWGPWSEGTVIFDPGRDSGYGHFMHMSVRATGKHDKLSDDKREDEWGGEYGPYIMVRYTTEAEGHCRIFYTMSTWNPYQVMVMRSDLRLAAKARNK